MKAALSSPTVSLLRRVPSLSSTTDRELAPLARLLVEVSLDAGTTLMTQGAYDSSVMLIVEGTASVHKHGRHVASLSAGEIVGELAAIDRQPRSATVVADTPMRVLVAGPREAEAFLAHPAIARAAMTKLVARFRTDPTLAA
jgi:CRP-like cAMP-binding protein